VYLVISNCGLQDDRNEGGESRRREEVRPRTIVLCRSLATQTVQACKHGIIGGGDLRIIFSKVTSCLVTGYLVTVLAFHCFLTPWLLFHEV